MATVTITNNNAYAIDVDLYRQYENKTLDGKPEGGSATTLEIDVSPVVWYGSEEQSKYYVDTYGSMDGVTVTTDVPAAGTTDATFVLSGAGSGKKYTIEIGTGDDKITVAGKANESTLIAKGVKTDTALAIEVETDDSTPKTFSGTYTFAGDDHLFIVCA